MIATSSLAVHVTRERFSRCLIESLSIDGRKGTHPARSLPKERTNEKRRVKQGCKIPIRILLI